MSTKSATAAVQPARTSLRPFEETTLLEGAKLVIGPNGSEARKVIDPKQSYLVVKDADRYVGGDVRALPLRNGASDVEIVGKDRIKESKGLAAQMAHYVENGGTVTIGKETGVLTEFDGTNATLETNKNGKRSMKQIPISGKNIDFGDCQPIFVKFNSPSIGYTLKNTEGVDELMLKAKLEATSKVDYTITIAGGPQHAMDGKISPMASVENETGVDLKFSSLEIKLNEARVHEELESTPMRARGMRAMPEAFSLSADVAEASESDAGILTMPLFSNFHVNAGAFHAQSFAAALNGTPNADMAVLPTKLDQKLSLAMSASLPTKVGDEQKSGKMSPQGSITMPGTPEHQPAGKYQLVQEGDVIASMETQEYTPKGKELIFNTGAMKTLTAEMSSKTTKMSAGEWKDVEGSEVAAPLAGAGARSTATKKQTRSVDAEGFATAKFSSTSKLEKEIEFSMPAGYQSQFGLRDAKVSNVKVTLNGQEIPAKLEGNTISCKVAVPANGSAELKASFSISGEEGRQTNV